MLSVLTTDNEILFVKDDEITFASLPTTDDSGRDVGATFIKFVPKNGPHRGHVHYVPLTRVAAVVNESS